jgi:hypothetical protein
LAAELLGLEARLHSSNTLLARIAQRLLEYPGDPVIGARGLQRFIEGVLAPLDRERRQVVLDIAFAHAVLPDDVRTQMLQVLECRSLGGAAAALAVEKIETGDLYLRRACGLPRLWNTHRPSSVAADGYLEELLAAVRTYLVESLGFDGDPSDGELADELATFEESSGPVVVILKAVPDQQLLRQLVSRLPRVLFLFVSGSTRPSSASLHWLEPALDRGQESDVLRVRRQIRSRLLS